MKGRMPPADDDLLVGIEINGLIGPPPDVSKHRYLLPSHGKVGDRSRRPNIDPHLTHINQAGKLSGPPPVLCVKICGMAVRTPVDDLDAFSKVLHFLKATNRAKDLLLKDVHLGLCFQNRWGNKVTFGILFDFWISSVEDQLCPILDPPIHFFQNLIQGIP